MIVLVSAHTPKCGRIVRSEPKFAADAADPSREGAESMTSVSLVKIQRSGTPESKKRR